MVEDQHFEEIQENLGQETDEGYFDAYEYEVWAVGQYLKNDQLVTRQRCIVVARKV